EPIRTGTGSSARRVQFSRSSMRTVMASPTRGEWWHFGGATRAPGGGRGRNPVPGRTRLARRPWSGHRDFHETTKPVQGQGVGIKINRFSNGRKKEVPPLSGTRGSRSAACADRLVEASSDRGPGPEGLHVVPLRDLHQLAGDLLALGQVVGLGRGVGGLAGAQLLLDLLPLLV